MTKLEELVGAIAAEIEARVMTRLCVALEAKARDKDPAAQLSPNQVRELARCRNTVVRDAIARGTLKAKLVGGRWLVRRGDATAWIEAGRP